MKDKIQSVLFDKRYFTFPKAKEYLITHGFNLIKVHETEHFYRFRQFNPIKGKHYVNRKSNERGVNYIIMY